MIYIYVYPVGGFRRTTSNKKILDAYAKNKGVERYALERFIEAINDESVDLINNRVRMIDDSEGCYPISSLHVNDLEESGFNTRKITESDLWTLVGKLNDDYRELVYWNSLKIIADGLNLPMWSRRKTIKTK